MKIVKRLSGIPVPFHRQVYPDSLFTQVRPIESDPAMEEYQRLYPS